MRRNTVIEPPMPLDCFIPHDRPAVPINLIGECDGKLMGAMEESAFPAGCAWIEPVRWEAAR